MKPRAFLKEAKQANLCIWLKKSQSEEPVGWGSEALYIQPPVYRSQNSFADCFGTDSFLRPFFLCCDLPRIHFFLTICSAVLGWGRNFLLVTSCRLPTLYGLVLTFLSQFPTWNPVTVLFKTYHCPELTSRQTNRMEM
uniref:Uncharacterized protein n=1 Tax=Pipistrellus kuhlii TaxID=59472 RepID=A0A7J7UA82_PIPKU|nr:hypothetical protein mPipKuh1_009142 [Pipistrellus kuhlii]